MKKIKLSRGMETLIDDEDYEKVNNRGKWYCSKAGYAVRDEHQKGKRIGVLLHRFIMNCPNNMFIDHIDGNPLNNQKNNLRICTHKQNHANRKPNKNSSSKYKGVTWMKDRSKWMATIQINNRTKFVGSFNNEEAAARAYDKISFEINGEFAYQNFPKKKMEC